MVSIIPSVVDTSVAALQRFLPIDRDCYSDSEFNLKILPLEYGYRLVLVLFGRFWYLLVGYGRLTH